MLSKINHTQLNNSFIDEWMHKLSGSATKVFIAISRKTIGWHKDTDNISLSQIMALTGLSNRGSIDAVKELESHGLIIVERTKNANKRNFTNTYSINYSDGCENSSQGCENSSPKTAKGCENSSHTKESIKENITKENNNKKEIINPILTIWNNNNIYNHNQETVQRRLKKQHYDEIEFITKETMIECINNYSKIYNSADYWYTHKWSLWDFIKRGYEKFLPEADPLSNFKRKELKQQKELDNYEVLRCS